MLNSLLQIGVQILTFAVVVAVSTTVLRQVAIQVDVRRRLGTQVASARPQRSDGVMREARITNPFLLWVHRSSSLADTRDQAKLARDLALAGVHHPAAPILYVTLRFGMAICLPLGFLLMQQLSAHPVKGFTLIGGTLGLCALGLIVPRALVDNRINARKTQLEQEFPDALDLTVVCVESGLGLESALVRVGQEVRTSHPRVAEEFGQVSLELSAGRSRSDALRALGERTDVASVRSFTALLIQTDTLGTSIGQTLRTYAGEMRAHRMLAAEEKAMRIPVLLTVPLVACILPVIITALMLPAIIDVVRNLLPAMQGAGH